jgi:hypothetical protein
VVKRLRRFASSGCADQLHGVGTYHPHHHHHQQQQQQQQQQQKK